MSCIGLNVSIQGLSLHLKPVVAVWQMQQLQAVLSSHRIGATTCYAQQVVALVFFLEMMPQIHTDELQRLSTRCIWGYCKTRSLLALFCEPFTLFAETGLS